MLPFINKGIYFLHINSNFETPNYENSLLNNFDFESEKKHYTPTYLMIHYFLRVSKIMKYENIIYFIARTNNSIF
jgi:hypothetical protein